MAYFARINDRAHKVDSWQQVSEAYMATVELLWLTYDEAPSCRITDDDGVTVAHVGYDGRVWLGAEHAIRGTFPIYDPA